MALSRKPGPDPVEVALTRFLEDHPDCAGLRVAFSGGRDSTVLLHALARLERGRSAVAIHVHHGLHPLADAQADHCRRFAAGLGLRFEVREVRLTGSPEEGVEAAARRLRYEALSQGGDPGDCVLTAHHATDQAETFLLAALKGSGPAGLAAMPRLRRLGAGWLGRPLLQVPGESIAAYALQHGLRWVEDPSNEDTRFDRNFVRREVLPVLASRFPVARRLGAAADLQAEVIEVLDGLLDPLLDALSGPVAGSLDLVAMLAHPAVRRPWLLRRFVVRSGGSLPRRGPLLEFLRQLAEAGAEASPALHWDGLSLRTYRGVLYLLRASGNGSAPSSGEAIDWPDGASTLTLPDGRLLTARQLREAGVGCSGGVQIDFRRGGETLRTGGARRALKTLMQERGIPPWRRAEIPLVRVRGELVAVLWEA
jgi:tRNA(Ile)-lysidine synthase